MFLADAVAKMHAKGYAIGNVDATIFAQQPKLGPAKLAIRESLAKLLSVSLDCVSVKAKTGERVGHIGRGEAIGTHAVVLIEKKD